MQEILINTAINAALGTLGATTVLFMYYTWKGGFFPWQ